MTAVLAAVAVVPLLAEPSLRAEQVTQLLWGEGARLVEERGEMLRVVTTFDDYHGWLHRGYVHRVDSNRHDSWLQTAAWSAGATLSLGAETLVAPHRARLIREGSDRIRLPDGRFARPLTGQILDLGDLMTAARSTTPAEWAWREFGGAPYLWGGLTRAGIDCSGLVQQTFAARGIPLPRDARDQITIGAPVELDQIAPDDLLYFHSGESDRVSHVAIAAADQEIVHATVATGRVTRERWDEGTRAAPLRSRLVAVRRLT